MSDGLRAAARLTLITAATCAPGLTSASEQSEGFDGFMPVILPLSLSVTLRTERTSEVETKDGTGQYARTGASLSAKAQLYRSDSDELTVNVLGAVNAIDSDFVLPDGHGLPEHLYRAQVGLGYRHVFPSQYAVGLSGSVSSASDQLFASSDETSIGATLFIRLPAGGQDAWMLFLNYANDRALLNNIPLPGVAYLLVQDRTWVAFIGLPFAFVTWRPDPQFEADLALSGLGSAHVGMAFTPVSTADWLRLSVAYDWRPETFKPVERPHADDQLIFREMRLTAGVGYDGGPGRSALCFAGYAFQREIFSDKSISGTHEDHVWLTPGWLLGLSLRMRF